MDISKTLKGTDYLMIGSNLVVESVIYLSNAKMCCFGNYAYTGSYFLSCEADAAMMIFVMARRHNSIIC